MIVTLKRKHHSRIAAAIISICSIGWHAELRASSRCNTIGDQIQAQLRAHEIDALNQGPEAYIRESSEAMQANIINDFGIAREGSRIIRDPNDPALDRSLTTEAARMEDFFDPSGTATHPNGLMDATAARATLARVEAEATALSRQALDGEALPRTDSEGFARRGKRLVELMGRCLNSKSLSVGARRAAKINLALNLTVPLVAISLSYESLKAHAIEHGEPEPTYPFDLMATSLFGYTWMSIVQCQNILQGNAGAVAPRTWRESLRWANMAPNYQRYIKWSVGMSTFYAAAIATEDAIRGKNIFEAEYLQYLGKEWAFNFVWDLGVGAFHVISWDYVVVHHMKTAREGFSKWLLTRLGKEHLVGKKGHSSFGAAEWAAGPVVLVDFVIRYAYLYTRSWHFVRVRHLLFNGVDPSELTEEEAQELLEEFYDELFERGIIDFLY